MRVKMKSCVKMLQKEEGKNGEEGGEAEGVLDSFLEMEKE
jgi:hypothetical protein